MSKFCVKCEHAILPGGEYEWRCWRPIGGISPVTGRLRTLDQLCKVERVDPTGCGPGGKFFEERT